MAPSSVCNMPCEGDTSEVCGTSWYLNLYTYNSSALPLCTGTSSTVSVAVEETSSLLSTYYSYSESSVTVTATVSSGAIETAGSVTDNVSGDAASATASTTSSAATSASTYPIHEDSDGSSDWYALGCGLDSEDRLLSSYFIRLDNMTVDSCLAICEDRGYMYGG